MAPATTPAWSGAVRALVAVLSGLALALCFEPYELPVLLPVGVAGFTLAVHGVRVRRGLWLGLLTGAAFMFVHLFWMRSVGWDAWLMLSTLETAFFVPLGGACAAVSRRRGLAGVDRRALGRRRGVAVRLAVRRDAVGPARLRLRRHARSAPALPYVGAIGVSLLIALVGTTAAWAVLTRPVPAGPRHRGRARPRAGHAAAERWRRTPPPATGSSPSPRSRATCPAPAPTSSTTTAR